YVGTSQNLRSRVRTYFTAAESRRRVLDMLPRAERISVIETTTATEAAVRELRIIGQEKPPSNRHGLTPEKALWLRLETGASGLFAPLASPHDVEPLRGLLTDAIIGRGSSLERAGGRTTHTDEGHRRRLHRAMTQDPTEVLDHAAARMRAHASANRYEDAERI